MKRVLFVVSVMVTTLVLFACQFAPSDATIGIDAPDFTQYETGGVGDFLDHRCGSLDCHGQSTRNLVLIRICYGLRLDPNETGLAPGCRASGGIDTQDNEYQASYRVARRARARGHERGRRQRPAGSTRSFSRSSARRAGGMLYKGGTLVTPGDDQDNCMTSWLAGTVNSAACAAAIAETP